MNNVYVVLIEYTEFEDSDSNSSDIIGVYSTIEKARNALKNTYENELNFQKEENNIMPRNTVYKIEEDYFIIDSANGVTEGFVSEEEVR